MKQKKNNSVLKNIENYTIYEAVAREQPMTINTDDITLSSYNDYYNGLLNIFKDGIETSQVQTYMITINFPFDIQVELSLFDYWLNLVMWYLIIASNRRIMARDIIFSNELKQDTIKDYIDSKLIDTCRKTHTNIQLNNIIDDTLRRFHDIDLFSFYLANTINLEDFVFLMKEDSEFYECMHVDLSGVSIDDAKEVGMQYTNKSIEIIKNRAKNTLGYDHCLADAFRASEGISPKQYKESMINIGTKPDGNGSVYPYIVNHSFINGGVRNPLDYFIDSSVGRTAQIIKFNNVGTSGHFARLLGLNNMDSKLYPDPNYDCHTKNYLKILIIDDKTLNLYNNRYYRLQPDGLEYIINSRKDKHLIGKYIYIRSPITCASAARGHGICYKCYGDLAFTVFNIYTQMGINIGRIASETLSSTLTQILLSAKHILESAVQKLNWVECFDKFFEITYNIIQLQDIDTKGLRILIDPDTIELENEEDSDLSTDDESPVSIYNEYITEFDIIDDKTKESWHICNDKMEKLYLTKEINSIIRRKAEPIDGMLSINLDELKDIPLFVVPIQNNEISRTLNNLKDLIDKNTTMKGKSIEQLLQEVVATSIEGNLNIASIHLEVILSNQVRDIDNILDTVDWSIPNMLDQSNPQYQILSLNRSLTDNPSVVISLSYQKIRRALYNPLTYKKNKPSFMDLFFMKQPQLVIRNLDEVEKPVQKNENGLIDPIIFYKEEVIDEDIEELDIDDEDIKSKSISIDDMDDE